MVAQRSWSSATWLAMGYAWLVLYASLFPFEGWRWPPGQNLWVLMKLPLALQHSDFDLWSNILGYLPLGLLVTLAARRSGLRNRQALWLALPLGAALSYGCELMQQFVPGRVPSLSDWVSNTAGNSAGAMLALAVNRLGWVDRWQSFRGRWFAGDAAFALALLTLWPVGLLFPSPVPLGLGQVGERLRQFLAALLSDVHWASALQALLAAPPPLHEPPLQPLAHAMIVALGLLAPCLVANAVVAPGWRRLATAAGALCVACAGLTLSALLNFGPLRATAWVSAPTLLGLALGAVGAVMLAPLSRRHTAGVGLVVLTALVVGVAHAPDNPYFEQSLHGWEQGRFVRFHGIAQWVGWLWPYAAMAWVLSRLGPRSDEYR